MNDFLSWIVISLNLPESQNDDPLSDNIDHPTLKTIVKWKNYPSAAITAVHENWERFTFKSVSPSKKLFYLLQLKPFKNDEKYFPFHLKNFFMFNFLS